ncbi:hypothetical protein ELQ94_07200 [Labedella endophytica]|uniref:Uncharacterized protein n=1 Tax=Labedella endophytica TaxID=1523160 RepID=A0A3S0XND1_9MICO|nr:hypothetical protein ELQ94_07200 [Labedella endophytica]
MPWWVSSPPPVTRRARPSPSPGSASTRPAAPAPAAAPPPPASPPALPPPARLVDCARNFLLRVKFHARIAFAYA